MKTINKEKWGDGPWQSEPDFESFNHAGFHCVIARMETSGCFNFYVAIPKGHPWHGTSYDDETCPAEAHGGCTYGRDYFPNEHPKPNDSDWVIGFDTAHAGDMCPSYYKRLGLGFSDDTYKDIDYVRAEVKSVAEQAGAAVQGVQP